MSDLLDAVLDAHGGLERWLRVRTLTAKLAVADATTTTHTRRSAARRAPGLSAFPWPYDPDRG